MPLALAASRVKSSLPPSPVAVVNIEEKADGEEKEGDEADADCDDSGRD